MIYCYLILNEFEGVYETYDTMEYLDIGVMYVNKNRGLFRVVELQNTISPEV